MPWCLTKPKAKEFRQALRSGEIDIVKMSKLSSADRRTFLESYVGKENSQRVNALFESKLLLKNQQQGMITWIKRVGGISKQTKVDLISRIERMEQILSPGESEAFYEDLASTRLGIGVTEAEAKNIFKLAQANQKSRDAWNAEIAKNPTWDENPIATKKEWENDPKRVQNGLDKIAIKKYINEIKLKSMDTTTIEAIKKNTKAIPGLMKSSQSTLDNSFWGRQGLPALLDTKTSNIWVKNFVKSYKDIGNELKGISAMDLIEADIATRPNAMNGKYKVGRYGLDVLAEEAFPESIGERIPRLGRLFKASETAYSGGALRLRADLADRLILMADEEGINTLNPTEARPIGQMVSSLTGRGSLGKAESMSGTLNLYIYSVKFLKSNFDKLLAIPKYGLEKAGIKKSKSEFASRELAKTSFRMIRSMAFILAMVKFIDPDRVDEDPRSTNFGKIKMFGRWIDITGGMGSLARLASRIIPTMHNGEWGFWSKSSTGNWRNLYNPGYGQSDAFLEIINSLFTYKLSPSAAILRDVWQGQMFGGEPFNITKSITNSVTPFSIQTFDDLKDEKFADILGLMLLELQGFSFGSYKYDANWDGKKTKEMLQFKEEKGADTVKEASDNATRVYNEWLKEVGETDEYKNLSDDGKSSLRSKAKKAIKDKIFDEYDFEYEKEDDTDKEEDEKDLIEDMMDEIDTH